jgi:Protein of unknown function (DUF2905)
LCAAYATHIEGMRRTLIIFGLAVAAIGFLWPWIVRLGLGRLPGDIHIRWAHGALYFPITTCILVSVAISLLLWLINR